MTIKKISNVWEIVELSDGGWQVERASYSTRFETAAEALAEAKRYDATLARKGLIIVLSTVNWTTVSAIGRDVVKVLQS